MATIDVIDESYLRLHQTGPEYDGWLSNHGPMAAEALVRLGRADAVETWVTGYRTRLDQAPEQRWTIEEHEWPMLLGEASRLGDWCSFFDRRVREESWTGLLERWWPRLLPGAVASATHGLIRTGHAVRSLQERESPERLAELATALGYWAARHQVLPGAPRPTGSLDAAAALDQIPVGAADGGIRERLARLTVNAGWRGSLVAVRPVSTDEVAVALDDLVDAAVSRYAGWAQAEPVMLVHAATAPRAVGLALTALPRELWVPSYETAWHLAATLSAAYRPAEATNPTSAWSIAETIDRTLTSGDEHAIKFVEVALESHRRGNPGALVSAAQAVRLIG